MTLLGRRRSLMLFGGGAALALAAFGLGACEGTLGDGGVSGPPDVEPKAVPESPALLSSTTTCIARSEGEHLLSVSPEGHAWLVTPGATTHVRVLDAFAGDITVTEDELEIADVQDGQAWSAGDAALISDGGLWRLEAMSRVDMTPPDGFETPASLCGDPSASGVLVSNGSVFERRSDGWWTWDPKAGALSSPSRVVRFDGECRSADDVMWLAALDGTLYRVEPSTFTTPIRFDGLVDLAATDGFVAALDASELWVGTNDGKWQPWTFSGEVPTSLSASAGVVWMVSGSQILRFDGSDWTTIANDVGEPIETVGAHAGGAWLEGASQICHASLGQSLRVEGVRPYLRSTELEYDVRVEASDGAMDLSAELDGAPVDLGPDAEPGWLVGHVRLESIGWHTLTVTGDEPSSARSIPLKRAPETERSWETDIQPIYAANCAKSGCHVAGSSDPPDLSSFDAWTKLAPEIQARVVEARTMPPASDVGPDWGEDDIQIVSEWIEGGMLP